MTVSDLEGPERFWFQFYGKQGEHYRELQSLMKELDNFYKSDKGLKFKLQDFTQVKVGTLLAATYQGAYHRVVVESFLPPFNAYVKLEYIDYGTKDFK